MKDSPMYRVFLVMMCVSGVMAAERIEVNDLAAQEHERMNILFALIKPTSDLKKVGAVIEHDLAFTKQFAVTSDTSKALTNAQEIKQLSVQGYPLVVYLQPVKGGYEWRLYDTLDARMVKGKKVQQGTLSNRELAHVIADDLWAELTGSAGFFSTKIVYGKEMQRRGRNCKRYLYMRDAADVTGESEQLLVSTPTISVAPRWNRDLNNPLVLYSEYTKTNVRLIAVNMKRQRRIVSNFDGVNMQVAYAPQGGEVVYCLSRAPRGNFKPHMTSQLYHYAQDPESKKTVFTRLTSNQGNNFSPCWGPADTLFYACDATPSGLPNICWYDLKTKRISWITQGCYATSPNYCAATNKVVYTKMVNKKMQLWEYDLGAQQHNQLTFDETNKDDCSWSPCGTHVTYSIEQKGKNRVAILNTLTGEQHLLTAEKEDCCYPAWSPVYSQGTIRA